MRAVLRWVAIGAGLVLVVAVALGWAAYRKFSGNIRTDRASARLLAQDARQRPRALVPGARNILVIGGDGPRGAEGAVLLHLSAGRRRATAVAVPGDLMVRAPRCPLPGGGTSPVAYERFAAAYRVGGAACSIRAFEQLSGIRVDHHLVVNARGFRKIAATVVGGGGGGGGGSRSGVGIGSGGSRAGTGSRGSGGDLLRDLARGAGGGLTHPGRLYGILDSATSSITADPGLSSLPALYELAGSLRALPPGALAFRTVPAATDGEGRDVPREPEAHRLFAAVRGDRPLDVP
ncbi:LCP family protein [Streptomyces sp. HPF1205]|uniref:LCP family protein n=1 Tax=Streptomyces sp. HPF1205 TaxID=2873262 RepID=UPI001CEDA64B|nr:LCP family protein [Streptomyces sp. HPF1205]